MTHTWGITGMHTGYFCGINEGEVFMNIRRSAQNVMGRMFLKKHGQTVKLHVWESWNPLIIYKFFFHKVATGCVQVAMMSVCLPPHTHLSITSNRIRNKFQPQAPPK